MRVLQIKKIGVFVNKRVYGFLGKKKKKEITHSVITKFHEKIGLGQITQSMQLYIQY